MKTLLLDTIQWDFVVDVAGNIAVASEPYSQAQDAASAIRLFRNELWYNSAKGIPYTQEILGKSPPLTLVKSDLVGAALTVPGVTAAQCFLAALTQRGLSGQVQITNLNQEQATAAF